VLRHPEFLAGAIDTGFLERHDAATLSAAGGPDAKAVALHAVAAALTAQAARRAETGVLPALTSGFRNVPSDLQRIGYTVAEGGTSRRVDVGYRLGAGGSCTAEVDGEVVANLLVSDLTPESVDLHTGPTRRRFTVARVGDWSYVDGPLGSSALHEVERLPVKEDPAAAGSLLAPMPGKVVRVGADPGDQVDAGVALVVLEAMKMEHAILAPFAGTVASMPVAVGDQVDTGQLLAVMATDGESPT
jgi:acetyl/propionyl-CoA carboxylase alpha subunit